MDMSKLPRMSNTAAPSPPEVTDAQPTPELAAYPARAAPQITSVGAEVWIAAALGAIFMIMGRTFAAYLFARLTGHHYSTGVEWHSGPNMGKEVEYPDLEGFVMLTDASIFLFGLTLVIDAVVLLVAAAGRRRGFVLFGLMITTLVTAFNGYVVARVPGQGVTPIISLMACAFGVYIAIYQWKLYQASRPYSRETPPPGATV